MIDFETCDALDRLHYDLTEAGKGNTKGADIAREQLEQWEFATPESVKVAREFCRTMQKADTKAPGRMFKAAQSFPVSLAVVLARMKGGEKLKIIDGRAALVGKKGGTYMGGKV